MPKLNYFKANAMEKLILRARDVSFETEQLSIRMDQTKAIVIFV